MNNQRKKKLENTHIKIQYRTLYWLIVLGLCVALFSGCQIKIGGTPDESQILDVHTFIDDAGNLIEIDTLPKTIVSLSSMHTENLFFLGQEKLIIGVDEGSNFPYDVIGLPHYDLNNDYQLNELIASDPDLILITPEMNEEATHIVSVLETSCRKVVSLQPNDLSEFDAYIAKLGMLTGSEDVAKEKLSDYHRELDRIERRVEKLRQSSEVAVRPTVFVEAAERGYETVYEGSSIDEALNLIQVDQLLEDNQQPYHGARTVPYGIDQLLEYGAEIDHYFTLQGRSGDGSSTIIIDQKQVMQAIKAVKEGCVHELLVPLIDNYTLRYPIGVEGLARQVYGTVYNEFQISDRSTDQVLTRVEMADLLYNFEELEPFTIIDKNYYEFEKFHHTFGSFVDVSWDDPDFHQIESVVMMAYIYPIKEVNSESQEVIETFDRKRTVTRSEIAKFIHTKLDVEAAQTSYIITDIKNHPDAKIIQKVVDAGYMVIEDSKFRPNDKVTIEKFVEILIRLNDRGAYE